MYHWPSQQYYAALPQANGQQDQGQNSQSVNIANGSGSTYQNGSQNTRGNESGEELGGQLEGQSENMGESNEQEEPNSSESEASQDQDPGRPLGYYIAEAQQWWYIEMIH